MLRIRINYCATIGLPRARSVRSEASSTERAIIESASRDRHPSHLREARAGVETRRQYRKRQTAIESPNTVVDAHDDACPLPCFTSASMQLPLKRFGDCSPILPKRFGPVAIAVPLVQPKRLALQRLGT